MGKITIILSISKILRCEKIRKRLRFQEKSAAPDVSTALLIFLFSVFFCYYYFHLEAPASLSRVALNLNSPSAGAVQSAFSLPLNSMRPSMP